MLPLLTFVAVNVLYKIERARWSLVYERNSQKMAHGVWGSTAGCFFLYDELWRLHFFTRWLKQRVLVDKLFKGVQL